MSFWSLWSTNFRIHVHVVGDGQQRFCFNLEFLFLLYARFYLSEFSEWMTKLSRRFLCEKRNMRTNSSAEPKRSNLKLKTARKRATKTTHNEIKIFRDEKALFFVGTGINFPCL